MKPCILEDDMRDDAETFTNVDEKCLAKVRTHTKK